MAPPAKLIKAQIVDAAVARIAAIDPVVDPLYYRAFDLVKAREPFSVQFLRHSGNEVPTAYERLAFVWHSEDPRAARDSYRNEGTLVLVVTGMVRYNHEDLNPFRDEPTGFKTRTDVRAEMESDLIRAMEDVRLGGKSVFARHVDTRVPAIATTYNQEWPWLEADLMFDVRYKYVRSTPWLTS